MLTPLGRLLTTLIEYYSFLLIARVILTWIPAIDWYQQPWRLLAQICDPYLNLFRRWIPPIGGIDISPIIALFALSFLQRLIVELL